MGSGISGFSRCCSTKSLSKDLTTRRLKPKWSELPTEVLVVILKRLAFVDILRFKVTCSSWNYAAKSYVSAPYYNLLHQTPWLILPSAQKGDATTCRFFSHAEKRFYTIKNVFEGFPCDNWCVGSSHGWLVILDSRENPHLLNPISGDRIRLPSTLTELVHGRCISQTNFCKQGVVKAVISSNPSRNNNFVVVVTYEKPAYLAFYRQGRDENWINLFDMDRVYCDIIFHNDQLFALATFDGSVEVWDFSNSLPMKTIYLQPSFGRRISSRNYLVESFGEFLRVERKVGTHNNSHRTKYFQVYKLNLTANKWDKVECLGDLVLFLGGNQSMSLSARDFPECEENSIYFTGNHIDMNPHNYGNGSDVDLGVYNLKDKVLKPFYQLDKRRIDRTPYWIVPNPW